MKINIFEFKKIYPLKIFGLTSNFWALHIETLCFTWGALAALLVFILVGRRYLKRERSRLCIAYEEILGTFLNLNEESFGTFQLKYYTFITTLFFFTLFCCLIGIIPFFDEATKDLNTTFALGLTSFTYVQYQKIKVHGLLAYAKEYLEPFFLLAPINIIGELAKIASMTFRLFGNILGGGVMLLLVYDLVQDYKSVFFIATIIVLLFDQALKKYPAIKERRIFSLLINIAKTGVFFITGLQFYGVFEGLIQAFVLTMLTTTYLAMSATDEPTHTATTQGTM